MLITRTLPGTFLSAFLKVLAGAVLKKAAPALGSDNPKNRLRSRLQKDCSCSATLVSCRLLCLNLFLIYFAALLADSENDMTDIIDIIGEHVPSYR